MWASSLLNLAYKVNGMADNKITGRAKKYDGTAIDYVSIFNWTDGKCIAQVTPDAAGVWTYTYDRSLRVGITYVADGCEPITHGAYDFAYLSGIPSDTILHYDFNGDLFDRSANLNHGIKNGPSTFGAGRKPDTQSFYFVSGNTLINTESPVVINANQLAISFWYYKKNGASQVGTIISNARALGGSSSFRVSDGSYGGGIGADTSGTGGSGQNILKTSANLNDSTWHHVFVQIDRAQNAVNAISIYIDNIKQSGTAPASSDFDNNLDSTPITIGGQYGTSNTLWAAVQDVRIYNRVLTISERESLFNE